ncbi:hypothetical protein SUGI_0757540 [Cryptomeria japonica]|nr:hypothetical protein SUGI_0757540 [Cryptomeria japonica]
MPEVEVNFMDLPSYDFISLFQMLPLPREGYINADKNGVAIRSYLAATVCGSHFNRLYSQKSLHFRHYSVSLHGISVRIPIPQVQMLIETEIRPIYELYDPVPAMAIEAVVVIVAVVGKSGCYYKREMGTLEFTLDKSKLEEVENIVNR